MGSIVLILNTFRSLFYFVFDRLGYRQRNDRILAFSLFFVVTSVFYKYQKTFLLNTQLKLCPCHGCSVTTGHLWSATSY